jgi:P27 family predicted phage terminase small subunit
MSPRGPKPTPMILRKLRGNPSRRPLPADEPEGVGDLWAPPAWFEKEQRDQWHYAIDHAPPGLLTGTDRETLAIWCVASVEYARAARKVWEMGHVVETKNGNAILNPHLSAMNRQALIILKAGGELGFSPAARASLGSRAPEFGGATPGGRRPRSSDLAAYLEQKPDKLPQ